MELSSKTKIDDLLNRYPFLLEYFIGLTPKFKLLQSTVTRKTIGKVATLSQVATIGGLDVDTLISGVAAEINARTGEQITLSGESGEEKEKPTAAETAAEAISPPQTPAAGHPAATDRKMRQEILKAIIKDLHKGEDMAVLKQRFQDLIKDVDPTEIAAMEQGLIEEGMPESEIKRLCDVHVEVFRESLGEKAAVKAPPGHPINTFMKENRAAEEIMQQIAIILNKACEPDATEIYVQYRDELEKLVDKLSQVDLHYLRKELQLFSRLEVYDIRGPSEVMWAIHDDIRSMFKTAKAHLAENRSSEALATIQELVKAVDDMIYKEERILFPMTMETLSDSDWQKVSEGEEEIGYAWIEPPRPYSAGEAALEEEAPAEAPGQDIELEVGHLSLKQVNLMLKHLPLELSFVDENDEVKYYSLLKHKIFARSKGSIGRKVQNCHPPRSLDKVQKILDEFRAGTRDVADFWINRRGRFVYIVYYAVRDDENNYRGTLEVVQDITEIKKLQGEKKLLDWE